MRTDQCYALKSTGAVDEKVPVSASFITHLWLHAGQNQTPHFLSSVKQHSSLPQCSHCGENTGRAAVSSTPSSHTQTRRVKGSGVKRVDWLGAELLEEVERHTQPTHTRMNTNTHTCTVFPKKVKSKAKDYSSGFPGVVQVF